VSHVFRYLVPESPPAGGRVELSDADTHHLVRVVRRGAGTPVELIDPDGVVWPATVVGTTPRAVAAVGAHPIRRPDPAPITICIGLCEWGRLDTAIEKCTELGIPRVIVFAGRRSTRVPDERAWDRRAERLGRVAEAAVRQSGQGRRPQIDGVWSVDRILSDATGSRVVVLDPRGTHALGPALRDVAPGEPVMLVVGPDVGFDESELDVVRSAGAAVCHLGDTTLRVETAAIAAASIALCATGGLDRGPGATPVDQEDQP
jgi:16S rRNA (uracil1498-N3)-methyltransferase